MTSKNVSPTLSNLKFEARQLWYSKDLVPEEVARLLDQAHAIGYEAGHVEVCEMFIDDRADCDICVKLGVKGTQ